MHMYVLLRRSLSWLRTVVRELRACHRRTLGTCSGDVKGTVAQRGMTFMYTRCVEGSSCLRGIGSGLVAVGRWLLRSELTLLWRGYAVLIGSGRSDAVPAATPCTFG